MTGNTGFLEATSISLTSCFAQVLHTSEGSCNLRVNPSGNYIISGGDGSKDACKGDSGGPLFVKVLRQILLQTFSAALRPFLKPHISPFSN